MDKKGAGFINRLGEIRKMKDGYDCKCIRYKSNKDGDYQVLDEHGHIFKNKSYTSFKNGTLHNPYAPSFHNIGFMGEGFSTIDKPKAYLMWSNIFDRLFSDRDHKQNDSYKDCSLDSSWYNFQNFVKWFDENEAMYNNEEPYNIDKDLLIKNNKIYSPKTCLLVPRTVNLFLNIMHNDTNNLPVGVTYVNDRTYTLNKPYLARCRDPFEKSTSKNSYIGMYATKEQAFIAYKKVKEKYAKQLAEYYKGTVDNRVIEGLNNFTVDIGDYNL